MQKSYFPKSSFLCWSRVRARTHTWNERVSFSTAENFIKSLFTHLRSRPNTRHHSSDLKHPQQAESRPGKIGGKHIPNTRTLVLKPSAFWVILYSCGKRSMFCWLHGRSKIPKVNGGSAVNICRKHTHAMSSGHCFYQMESTKEEFHNVLNTEEPQGICSQSPERTQARSNLDMHPCRRLWHDDGAAIRRRSAWDPLRDRQRAEETTWWKCKRFSPRCRGLYTSARRGSDRRSRSQRQTRAGTERGGEVMRGETSECKTNF